MKEKRLIIIATNKGGVGKSFTAINIADFLKERNVNIVAFDPDHANASFARFFTKKERPEWVKIINIADDTSLDQITKALEAGAEVALVDGVGSQQTNFLNWMEEIDLYSRAPEMNLKITLVLIVDEDKDTVDQAKDVAGRAGDQVDYIVVRNLKTTSTTTIYDDSAARKMLTNILNAKEITFPKLKDHLVTMMQSKSLRLAEAEKDPEVYTNDRKRIETYRKKITQELEKASDYLLPKKSQSQDKSK